MSPVIKCMQYSRILLLKPINYNDSPYLTVNTKLRITLEDGKVFADA